MAAALGGLVVTDPQLAELGTLELLLTEEGKKDPIFGGLGKTTTRWSEPATNPVPSPCRASGYCCSSP